MRQISSLSLAGIHHSTLMSHLFPGDGLESAAILLCNRVGNEDKRLIVTDIILAPHDTCRTREKDYISWSGYVLEEAIHRAESDSLSLILIHSHPGGFFGFSKVDDKSDQIVLTSIFNGIESQVEIHGSAIMTSNGAILARVYSSDLSNETIPVVFASGDDINIYRVNTDNQLSSRPMAFTSDMTKDLSLLSACVVGISGTGSVIAEQLARLGFGELILIDFDIVEIKNLNRILNSKITDAQEEKLKTSMFSEAISQYRDKIKITTINTSINTRGAVVAASQADFLFCCVDTVEGRLICDKMSEAFIQPLFDVGVTIPTRKTTEGNIAIGDINGRVDFVQPGVSSLYGRGVYTSESLYRESLMNTSPDEYESQVNEGYVKGMAEEAPSVISLNMRAASACVLEFIARVYPFRHEPNREYARSLFSIAACEEDYISEDSFKCSTLELLGQGMKEPLLGLPALAKGNT